MFNLYSIANQYNGFYDIFLIIITLISTIAGIFIIITKNPIISVLYLILLFSSIACYLIFIGIKFIGISYLLVYVGAVSILFLFILMLINIRVSELISDTNNNIPLAILTVLAFFIPYSNILPDSTHKTNSVFTHITGVMPLSNQSKHQQNYLVSHSSEGRSNDIFDFITLQQKDKNVSYVSSNSWDGNIVDISDIMSIGNIMYTSYSIWLIITSIILLLAMVGSIVITIKQKY